MLDTVTARTLALVAPSEVRRDARATADAVLTVLGGLGSEVDLHVYPEGPRGAVIVPAALREWRPMGGRNPARHEAVRLAWCYLDAVLGLEGYRVHLGPEQVVVRRIGGTP